jgi:flagellar motility protein MotE (MotC chaperone)
MLARRPRALLPTLCVTVATVIASGAVSAQTAAATCAEGPPTLSGEALKDELNRRERARKAELQRLEAVRTEIAEARTALAAEVARLEDAIERAARIEEERQRQEQAAPQLPTDPIARKKYEEQVAADRAKLAKAIKSMPPPDAAKLLKTLARPLAADLLARIRPAEAGLILAAMNPKEAAALTAIVAGEDTRK